MPTSHYSKSDLVAAFKQAGVVEGDVVLSYTNVGLLGIPHEGNSRQIADQVLLDAFQEVIGSAGTLCVPVYTYSFGRREPFDPDNTPSAVPGFPEFVRRQSGARRTCDPMFSVAAVGARANELTRDVPLASFAPGCFWQRFIEANGWVVNVNVWAIAGLAHYVERRMEMPYRFDKLFIGDIVRNGRTTRLGSIFSVQDATNPDTRAEVTQFDALAFETGLAQKIPVGRGYITAMRARDMAGLLEEALTKKPTFMIQAGLTGKTPVLANKRRHFDVVLPQDAGMKEMMEALWNLPRDIVSDGYDAALEALAGQVPMKIHGFPSGMHAWTWLVPEKWTCHEAWLETMDGRRLFSYEDQLLHVVSYSLPFEGVVSREELFKHLHTHPVLPDETVFMFKYYDRDWGLCCPRTLKDTLTDPEYRVRIRSEFSYGFLNVGEVFVQGESDDCIVLCAHLCHPGQAADDLSGVVAGIEIMRRLRQMQGLRYSYRFLMLPETIGSVAWLSQNEHLIPKMKGGLFIEMVSLPNPPALQYSFEGDTLVDRCFAEAFAKHAPQGWTGAFRTVIGNDERQFNSPGVRVPMLSLSRIQQQRVQEIYPYPEYHSSADTPDKVSWPHMEDTVNLVLKMIESLEKADASAKPAPSPKNSTASAFPLPRNLFKGEVFCSRYGLYVDIAKNPQGHRALFDILYLIDGRHSVEDMAAICKVPLSTVQDVLTELARHGLVAWDSVEAPSLSALSPT